MVFFRGPFARNLTIVALLFSAGVLVDHFLLQNFKTFGKERFAALQMWLDPEPIYSRQKAFFDGAFTKELIKADLLLPPMTNVEEIRAFNQSIFMKTSWFEDAYDTLKILGSETVFLDHGETHLVKVRFSLHDKEFVVYAYGEPLLKKIATPIIPGSGENQSFEIYKKNVDNYQYGIVEALADFSDSMDVFVLIKPNSDSLANHHGHQRLSENAIVNYQINRGGSYSISYIIQSMAFTKYLQSTYGKIILAGLSQGGGAVLLNALQTKPDLAIVSSGYSTLFQQCELSGTSQILDPTGTLASFFEPAVLLGKLKQSPTHFLFTWGKKEKDIYQVEAMEQPSAKFLEPLPMVECVSHEGGHVYPKKEIQAFLSRHLGVF